METRMRSRGGLLVLLLALALSIGAVGARRAPLPPPPSPDLSYDVVSLTHDEALLSWHDGKARRQVQMSREDFDRMFGSVHVTPLPPEKQAK